MNGKYSFPNCYQIYFISILYSNIIVCIQIQQIFKQQFKMEEDKFQPLRSHFNITFEHSQVKLILINEDISPLIFVRLKEILDATKFHSFQIEIMGCANFTDECLITLAEALPECLEEVVFDFSSCEMLRGDGFLELLQKLSQMTLRKFHLDLSEIENVDDIVMEGISMILKEQNSLEYLYLDLYENISVTGDGITLLSQGIEELKKLDYFYLDVSAQDQLTEDSLELLFDSFNFKGIRDFTFRILDIETIGGGSFFKLAEKISGFTRLEKLNLKIGSFDQFNIKAIQEISGSFSKLEKLKSLTLNFSDIKLKDQVLFMLTFPLNLKYLDLDFSCNTTLSKLEYLSDSIPQIESFGLNLDFCDKIREVDILKLICAILNKGCKKFKLSDRVYSRWFAEGIYLLIGKDPCLSVQMQVQPSMTNTNKMVKNHLLKLKILKNLIEKYQKKGVNRRIINQLILNFLIN